MAEAPARLYVLAGTDGAGKSSIGGAMFRQRGVNYFNPDEAARAILARNPGASADEANSAAWHEGKRLLQRAIAERLDFAIETTLGGDTIAGLLSQASEGMEVRIWYAGLSSPELHLARVRARVAKGGHDIPEADIRRRYDHSRLNLIRLLPRLAELRLYDNSIEGDPDQGATPAPVLVLHGKRGRILNADALPHAPGWARPIVAAAMKIARRT